MNNLSPEVSIGMPVYNAEATLRAAIDSILQQTFTNFELIISDNCSTDGSTEICKEYADKDDRIRYFKQKDNLGGLPNFKFVFDLAGADYFMWSASDDIRSPDFLEVNYKFLAENSEYTMSTSPNWFENWGEGQVPVDFTLEGDSFNRLLNFFKYSFKSHGLFYSLFRTKVLRDCELIDQIFPGDDWLGFDWAVILYLSSKGRVNRTTSGSTIFGVNGDSCGSQIFKRFNESSIEWFFPFYKFSKVVINLTRTLSLKKRLRVYCCLIKLNIHANIEPIRMWSSEKSYQIYSIFLKPVVKVFIKK